jgi:hypothetical protein
MVIPDADDLSGEPRLYRPRRKTQATSDEAAVNGARVIHGRSRQASAG